MKKAAMLSTIIAYGIFSFWAAYHLLHWTWLSLTSVAAEMVQTVGQGVLWAGVIGAFAVWIWIKLGEEE